MNVTIITFSRGRARASGWATPFMARQVRRSSSGDLGRLRAVLEG